MAGQERAHRIGVSGIFGLQTRLPLVQVEIPLAATTPIVERGPDGAPGPKDGVIGLQLRPDEARSLALNLLEGAEAALGDGFLLTFLGREVGLSLEQLAPLLLKFRGYRTRDEREGA